ncbi:MAG: tetratricopeptide repeat protein [Bdellovibrionales bacterium]|nr:tetratricopeptide repeat protein [Bdellovibrionales bacterium]
MKRLFLLFLCIGCVGTQKPLAPDIEDSYHKALDLTESSKADKALKAWDQFLQKYPTTRLTASALYYKAVSYERLGQYQSAVNTYRSAITIWGVRSDKDRAQSLLRISACYEAMSENAKSLATLQELEKDKSILSYAQRNIEIPARKALLYAKEKNSDEAKKYYKIATKNMNQYLRQSGAKTNEWLAEILYRLSETNPALSLPDFQAAIDALAINQSYLAKTIEMDIPFWSAKATQRLSLQLEGLKTYLQKYVTSTDVIERREQEEQQRQMAASFIDVLDKLSHEFLSDSKVYEDKVAPIQQKIKSQVVDLLLVRSSGEGLTEESQQRQGLKRGKKEALPPKKTSPVDPNL